MNQQQFKLVEEELGRYRTGNRTASAALLAWFLEVVWRIESEEVNDAICDGPGDKGIDGLLADEDLREITIFQSKHRDAPSKSQGDADLKALVGAAAYFETPATVDGLLASKPNAELRRLLNRLDVRNRVGDGAHVTRLAFVTNGGLDPAGDGYVKTLTGRRPLLEVWDGAKLAAVAERTRRPELLPDKVILNASASPTTIALGGKVRIAVGLVPAPQLVSLPGLADLSLFDRNVRLHEGRTRINRELGETISDPQEHALFPAYHNGVTMLTHGLQVNGTELKLDGVTVVNGCQSLVTLHGHGAQVSDELRVLVKVVEVERHSDLADKITYRSNNQNPVDIRDQRSTDVIQRDLQKQVHDRYGQDLAYEIREGEHPTAREILDNKVAAQFLMAVYQKEPWLAVRKVRLFDEEYHRIFNRTVDAPKLFLLHHLSKVIGTMQARLRPELAASFATVRLTIAHLVGQVLRETERGRELLESPGRWLPDRLSKITDALTTLTEDVVDSVNFYVENEEAEKGESFDPKVVFKSASGVRPMENEVLRSSRRQAKRNKDYFFDLKPLR